MDNKYRAVLQDHLLNALLTQSVQSAIIATFPLTKALEIALKMYPWVNSRSWEILELSFSCSPASAKT